MVIKLLSKNEETGKFEFNIADLRQLLEPYGRVINFVNNNERPLPLKTTNDFLYRQKLFIHGIYGITSYN